MPLLKPPGEPGRVVAPDAPTRSAMLGDCSRGMTKGHAPADLPLRVRPVVLGSNDHPRWPTSDTSDTNLRDDDISAQ